MSAAGSLLGACDLERRYRGRGLLGHGTVTAVDGVSLEVAEGEALGLVGQSGSGKSTLARLLLALERPDRGTVRFAGVPISHLRPAAVRPLRRRFQAVFQDPVSSLDPRLRVGTIVSEPLLAHRLGDRTTRRARVAELLGLVGLPADAAERYPAAFSGGERQRIAIARALAPAPELLVLDEPVSSLDVVVQGQILDLLAGLRRRFGLSLLLISHELEVVREVCDRVAVMVAGAIVELGSTEAVLDRPAHPHTRALEAARPLGGQLPAGAPPFQARAWPPGACRWAPRCPLAVARCTESPPLEEVAEGHLVACWRAEPGRRKESG